MTEVASFRPDWVSPPGDTIEDLLEERGWTQAEFANRTGFTRKHANDLVKARATITAATASRLSTVLGSSAQFWMTREVQYRTALERAARLESLCKVADWLSEFPISWMVKHGWIRRFSHKGEQVEECLRFFGVASIETWQERYARPLVAFRASDKAQKKDGAVAAWLRQAEREAAGLPTSPYNEATWRDLLPGLRSLTVEKDPRAFVPRLQQACAGSGVAVVFVPSPRGCPIHGATRWLTPDKAMLALTLRYKTNDQLWFSFFHEAYHILKHAKKQVFVEGFDGLSADLEVAADRFASDILIPPENLRELSTLLSHGEVEAFARQLTVAPGVLVGRMQREGWIPWSHLNNLKVRYEWVEDKEGES